MTILTYLVILTTLVSFAEPSNAIELDIPKSVYSKKAINNNLTSNQTLRLSEIAYRQFQPIQSQISEEKYDQALNALNRLAKRYQNKPYVISIIMQSAAYIYIAQENYSNAIIWLSRVLSLSAMSTSELQSVRHNLSQLYFQKKDYKNAANTMKAWLKIATPAEKNITDYEFLAIAEFHLEHYKATKLTASEGLALLQHRQNKQNTKHQATEALYLLILSSELALKQYQNAEKTLKILVELNPKKKNYWQQLVGIYDVLEQPVKALAAIELMVQRNMLNSEPERVQYIQRLVHQNNAFKAANKLKQYIETKEIKDSTENLLLLADAWERSGENTKAIAVLAPLDSKQTLSRLSRIYTNEKDWQRLAQLLTTQLRTPITRQNESLYLQLGYTLNKLGKLEEAVSTFLKLTHSSTASKETKESANEWVTYLRAQ